MGSHPGTGAPQGSRDQTKVDGEMTLIGPTANGGRNECDPACLPCLGTVWSGVVSTTLFARIPTDCRPPVASFRELGVGASAFHNLQAQQAQLGRQTTVGESSMFIERCWQHARSCGKMHRAAGHLSLLNAESAFARSYGSTSLQWLVIF